MSIAIEAATLVAKHYADKAKLTQQMTEFSRLLAANNAVLIEEVRRVVHEELVAQRMNDLQSELNTLSRLFQEFGNAPTDFAKINEVDIAGQRLLDLLTQNDFKKSGIRIYLTSASMRMAALCLKQEWTPGNIFNAKNLALTAINYSLAIGSQLVITTKSRISGIKRKSFSTFGGGGGEKPERIQCNKVCFDLDGGEKESITSCEDHPGGLVDSKRLSDELEVKRSRLEQSLLNELPLQEIDKCVREWEKLAAQIN